MKTENNIKIIHQPEIKVCGLSVELTRSQTENYSIITKQWQKFNRVLNLYNPIKNDSWVKFGVTYKLSNYFYMPSVILIPDAPFEKLKIQSGKYAQFQHIGDRRYLKHTIYDIYKKLLPETTFHLDSDRTILHYERYDHRFHWNRDDSVIEILVPIE